MLKWLSKFSLAKSSFSNELYSILGFLPKRIEFYHQAFSHSSIEHQEHGNNERLEFLGDAIFNAVITEYLFHKMPQKDEGTLTDIRSKMVSRKTLNLLAKKIKIDKMVRTNLGDKIPSSVYGNAFEALIAAIYLDKGAKFCNKFIIKKIIEPHFSLDELETEISSYKKHFIHWAQKNNNNYSFILLSENGKAHIKDFVIGLFLKDENIATARAGSKKKAEEAAAKKACQALKI